MSEYDKIMELAGQIENDNAMHRIYMGDGIQEARGILVDTSQDIAYVITAREIGQPQNERRAVAVFSNPVFMYDLASIMFGEYVLDFMQPRLYEEIDVYDTHTEETTHESDIFFDLLQGGTLEFVKTRLVK